MARLSQQLIEQQFVNEHLSRTERRIAGIESEEKRQQYNAEKQKVSDMSYNEYISHYKSIPSWLKEYFPSPSELNTQRQKQIQENITYIEGQRKWAEESQKKWERKERKAKDRHPEDKEYIERTNIMQNYYQGLKNKFGSAKATELLNKGYTARSIYHYFADREDYDKQKKLGQLEKGYKYEFGKLVSLKPEIITPSYDITKPARLITIAPMDDSGKQTQFIRQLDTNKYETYKLDSPITPKLKKGEQIQKITPIKTDEGISFETTIKDTTKAWAISTKTLTGEKSTGKKYLYKVPEVYGSAGVVDFLRKNQKPFFYTKTGEAKFIEGETSEEQRKFAEENIPIGAFKNIKLGELKKESPVEYAKMLDIYGITSGWDYAEKEMIKRATPSDIGKLSPEVQKMLNAEIKTLTTKGLISVQQDKEFSSELPASIFTKIPLIPQIVKPFATKGITAIERESFLKESQSKGKTKSEAWMTYLDMVSLKTIEDFGEMIPSLSKPASKTVTKDIRNLLVGISTPIYKFKTGKDWKTSFNVSKNVTYSAFNPAIAGIDKRYEKIAMPIRKKYRIGVKRIAYPELSESQFKKYYTSPTVQIGSAGLGAGITLFYGTKLAYSGVKSLAKYSTKYGVKGFKPKVLLAKKTPVMIAEKKISPTIFKADTQAMIYKTHPLIKAQKIDINKVISYEIMPRTLPAYSTLSQASMISEPMAYEQTWRLFNVKTAKPKIITKLATKQSKINIKSGFGLGELEYAQQVPYYSFGKIKWKKVTGTEYSFIKPTTASKLKQKVSVDYNIPKFETDVDLITDFYTQKVLKSIGTKGIKKYKFTLPSGTETEIFSITKQQAKTLKTLKDMQNFEKQLIKSGTKTTKDIFSSSVYSKYKISEPKRHILESKFGKKTYSFYEVKGKSADIYSQYTEIFGKEYGLEIVKTPKELKIDFSKSIKSIDIYGKPSISGVGIEGDIIFVKSKAFVPKTKQINLPKINNILKDIKKSTAKLSDIKIKAKPIKAKPIKATFKKSIVSDREILNKIIKDNKYKCDSAISQFQLTMPPKSKQIFEFPESLDIQSTIKQFRSKEFLQDVGQSLLNKQIKIKPISIGDITKITPISKLAPIIIFKPETKINIKPLINTKPLVDDLLKQDIKNVIKQMQKIGIGLKPKTKLKTKTKTKTKTLLKTPTTSITTTQLLRIPNIIPPKIPIIPKPDFELKKPKPKRKTKKKKLNFKQLLAYSPTVSGIIARPKPIKIKKVNVPKLLRKIQTGIELRLPVKVVK